MKASLCNHTISAVSLNCHGIPFKFDAKSHDWLGTEKKPSKETHIFQERYITESVAYHTHTSIHPSIRTNINKKETEKKNQIQDKAAAYMTQTHTHTNQHKHNEGKKNQKAN